MLSTTGGPSVRFGTKWASMMSTCSMVAPPRSTRSISSAKCAKSADRIDGTICTIWILGLSRSYHSGKETVAYLEARNSPHNLGRLKRQFGQNVIVFFPLQRACGIDQGSARSQHIQRIPQQGGLTVVQLFNVGRF